MIKISNIEKVYNKESQVNSCKALSNINLKLPDKGLVFISGRSGSGKTTLLNILSGLDKPTSGEIITNYSSSNFYSMVFQDYQLIDYLTVKENIMLASTTNDISAVCEKCQISDILDHYPNQISGGQKQRVAITRAILMNKPVIFCDEPTGNLDEENSKIIASLLKNESVNKLVVVVSHDKEIFENVADEVIEIKNGTIINQIDDDLILNDEIKVDEKIFGLKEKTFIIFRILKKNIVKNIFMITSMILVLLLIISSFNILCNNDSVIRYNYYKNDDISQVDFKIKSQVYSDESRALSTSEQEYYLDKYDSFMFYDYTVSLKYDDNRIEANRVYVTSNCPKQLLYGNGDISGNEIVISDYIASNLSSNLEGLIGQTIGSNMIVAGIFETGYLKEDRSNVPDILEKLYCSIYMTEDNFYSYNGGKYSTYVAINDKLYSSTIKESDSRKIVAGAYQELQSGEIAIGKGIALNYSDDISSLVDTEITIDFSNKLDLYDSSSLGDIKSYTFTVKYIFNTTSYSDGKEDLTYDVVMNSLDMESYYRNLASEFYENNGLSIINYSKSVFEKLSNNDFVDDTFISFEIDDSIEWLQTLSYILLAIGISLTLIMVLIIINYVHNVLDKDKRFMGVLASIGLKRNTIMLLYYFGVVILALISFAITMIAEIFAIMLINSIIKGIELATDNIVYYGMIAPIILFAFIAVVLGLVYFIFYLRFKNKQTIDIIYER
ncbi:MAG: ATP-binding cassette domain-containing protein [Acholeplasmatales bacterium]|nr:ATP-binding cassette domain-containing protein [Acholeplasmatales bacterium]